MKTKILLICAIAITVFASCHKDIEITDDESFIFSFHRWGGGFGLDEKLEINAETTHYSISYYDLQTMPRERISYQTTVKTSDEQWAYLIKAFDLETFTRIQNGSCRACLDGADEVFSVTQNGETYSFSNGDGDEQYRQMRDFFDAILEQVSILGKYH